ncbi:hypothetical protein GCM10025876_27060 [Demequina litorisediminis]|uniref:Alpha-D-phosphohexomutase alpha/beta/alpha domain-containing protein n=1 Tax=Demequina litorisediminis TaxID=1849022 RepID=A0ABQ6IIC7_9MICO|nr:hypothetical protein GCM10025876_27060 [Demequina litorisediminis]
MNHAPDLTGLIKSYDVRGIVGDDLTDEVARAIGAAFADAVVLPEGGTRVVIGHDMRDSGPGLVAAVGTGLRDRGVDVTEIGLCSTDGLYHASGVLEPARHHGDGVAQPRGVQRDEDVPPARACRRRDHRTWRGP